MTSTMILVLTVGVISLAALTRATIGFGDALLAMPLLVLLLGAKTATPLVALCAALTGISILARRWRQLEFRTVWRLLFSALLGIPVGLWGLTALPERTIKVLLGVLIITSGLFNLIQLNAPQLKNQFRPAYIAGFLSGMLGGAYNLSGPPVVVYAALCRWPSERFIATLQAYFLPTSLLILVGHGLAGLWTPFVIKSWLFAAPAIVLSVLLGDLLNRRITHGAFDRMIHLFLLAVGVTMIVL